MGYVRIPVDSITIGGSVSGATASTVLYSDSSSNLATLSTLKFDASNQFLGIGTSSPAAGLHLAGDLSSGTALGVGGVTFRTAANTITDTTSSGTVASVAVSSFGIPTLAASAATTFTNSATVYIAGATVAGTNVTATNKFALWVAGGDIKLGVGNVVLDTVTGTQIGTATSQKLAFLGATPIVQRVGAAQAAVAGTAATNSSPYGYAQAQADAIVTLVNELRAAMIAFGLIKGAA